VTQALDARDRGTLGKEPSKPVHVHLWRGASCRASRGMRPCSRQPAAY
jgi:hypothetical protein